MEEQDRLALEYMSGELSTAEARIYEHVASTFRWLMATLFAANGGAILALMHDLPPSVADLWSLAFFASGTILSLLTGVLSVFAGYKASHPLTKARAKVQEGLITGESEPAQEALPILKTAEKITKRPWAAYAALGALACYIWGIGTVVIALVG